MKALTISILVAVILIGGAIVITRMDINSDTIINVPVKNVSIIDGKQIIEIHARGGYQPRKSIAKVGVPTVLRFNTSGTFDCSSAVRIPSLDISKNLPASGVTDIDIGNPKRGILQGMCGMGMYPFEIDFQN